MTTNEQNLKIIRDFLCKIGFHRFGEWKNTSFFYSDGYSMSFGWVARKSKECDYCGAERHCRPVSKLEREVLIKSSS